MKSQKGWSVYKVIEKERNRMQEEMRRLQQAEEPTEAGEPTPQGESNQEADETDCKSSNHRNI